MALNAEKRIGTARAGELTQGVIFSGISAEHYRGCELHGIVITARCDVAQSKVPFVNYLPIVHWSDWLERDGRLLLCQRVVTDRRETIKSALTNKSLSPEILSLHPHRLIVETYFPVDGSKKDKTRDRLDTVVVELDRAGHLLSRPASEACSIDDVALSAKKLFETLVREVFQQKLTGYYFLPAITSEGTADPGYVVLLRQVGTLPASLANAVADGCDLDRYSQICAADATCNGQLRLSQKDLACPVGRLRSPEIEHLMQTFSLLFGRIGVADYEHALLQRLLDHSEQGKTGK